MNTTSTAGRNPEPQGSNCDKKEHTALHEEGLPLDTESQEDQRSREPVLSRGLRVLEALSSASTPMRLKEIRERANLPLTTTHRLVGALVEAGALEQVRPRHYQISPRLVAALSRAPTATACYVSEHKTR